MKKQLRVAASVIAVLMWASAHSTPVGAQQEQAQRVEVTAKRFSYEPAEITLKKGEPVVLELKSLDIAHGLKIREFHVDVRASKGGSKEVQFTPDKAGDFVGHCSVFCGSGHGSMVLKIHVVD